MLEVFPLLPGDGLYRRRDFESLPEPPAADLRQIVRVTGVTNRIFAEILAKAASEYPWGAIG